MGVAVQQYLEGFRSAVHRMAGRACSRQDVIHVGKVSHALTPEGGKAFSLLILSEFKRYLQSHNIDRVGWLLKVEVQDTRMGQGTSTPSCVM